MGRVYTKNCKVCGIFSKNHGKHYCSHACMVKDPEHIAKISPTWLKKGSMVGRRYQKGQKSPSGMLGKKQSLETKIKMRASAHRGESNNMWKGGITPVNQAIRTSAAYKDWRVTVFQRDNYTCLECGSRGVTLHADHIKPFAYYPELRLVITNGRTLCVPCHKKTDTYSGRASNQHTLWQEKH